jgi:hypothetical protein
VGPVRRQQPIHYLHFVLTRLRGIETHLEKPSVVDIIGARGLCPSAIDLLVLDSLEDSPLSLVLHLALLSPHDFSLLWQGVGCFIVLSGPVSDLEVVLGEEVRPACLPQIELLFCAEVLQRSVVSNDQEFGTLETYELCSPALQCQYHCQQLLVVDPVVELSPCIDSE